MPKIFFNSKNTFFLILLIIIQINITFLSPSNFNRERKIPSKPFHSFCGVDFIETDIFNKPSDTNKTKSKKFNQKLTSGIFTPVRIFLDTTFLDYQVDSEEDDSYIREIHPIIKSALSQALNAISQIIKVEQYEENVFINGLTEELLQKNGIEKWDAQLNDLNFIHENYDYIFFPKFTDFGYSEITASANPIYLAENTNRPLIGKIQISYNLYNQENLEEYLKYVFLHETIHAFGFLKQAFQYFPGGEPASIFTEIGVGGIERTFVKTKKVLNFAKKYFGCETIKGVELENQGLDGSKNNHWDSRILLGELMISEQYEEEGALSEFTLAFLEDSGWYQVNYYSGGLMRFGKNKGCEFLNTYCVKGINNITNFPNEFYDNNITIQGHPTCTTGRLSRVYYNLKEYEKPLENDAYEKLLPEYDGQYIGGYISHADYCPIGFKSFEENKFGYLIGNCKYGNGNYGLYIQYTNSITGIITTGLPNGYLSEDFGEIYSDNSFCFMNTLVPDNSKNIFSLFGSVFHPLCFPSFCSSESLTIKIYNQYIVCPRQGGNVEVKGYQGLLLCPDYNLICTGTVLCNNIYDCIEKKSMLKENTLTYDYEPIITQRYSELESVSIINAYEISNDGLCPINCVQCTENKKCIKCKEGLNLIGQNENDENPIICNDNIDISLGYYLNSDDGVYYKCHDNCLKCSGAPLSNQEMNCLQCKEGFDFNEETKSCKSKEEEGSNTLTIILSAVGGAIAVTTAAGTVIYVKKKSGKTEAKIEGLKIGKTEINMTLITNNTNKSSNDNSVEGDKGGNNDNDNNENKI